MILSAFNVLFSVFMIWIFKERRILPEIIKKIFLVPFRKCEHGKNKVVPAEKLNDPKEDRDNLIEKIRAKLKDNPDSAQQHSDKKENNEEMISIPTTEQEKKTISDADTDPENKYAPENKEGENLQSDREAQEKPANPENLKKEGESEKSDRNLLMDYYLQFLSLNEICKLKDSDDEQPSEDMKEFGFLINKLVGSILFFVNIAVAIYTIGALAGLIK